MILTGENLITGRKNPYNRYSVRQTHVAKSEIGVFLSPSTSFLLLNLFTLYINSVRTAQRTFKQLQKPLI